MDREEHNAVNEQGADHQLWLKSIEDDLRRKDSYSNINNMAGHSIFRVPRQLRDVNPLAYDPLVVAIGPYKKSRKLQPSVTESFMRISAAKILLSMQNLGPEDFQVFASKVVGDVEKLGMQYERMPIYNEDALKAVFALDASFVACSLVYLRSSGKNKDINAGGDHLSLSSELGRRVLSDLKIPKRLVTSIVRDLFLLENQIPLSLIKGAFDSVSPKVLADHEEGEEEDELLAQCIDSMVRCVNPFQVDDADQCSGGGGGGGGGGRGGGGREGSLIPHCIMHSHTHLLDCLYAAVTMGGVNDIVDEMRLRAQSIVAIGGWTPVVKDVEAQMGLPSAVETAIHLRRAGIVFKPTPISETRGEAAAGAPTVQSIRFDKVASTLYLPRVKIGPESEAVLRNLAAYEMVALQRAEVGSYLALMDDLIDTAEDVQVLRLSGVLTHSLRNDQEVAELWNSMCTNLQVLYESAALAQAYSGIKDHLRRRIRYKRLWELYADFSSRYLSAPWLTASVLAATLLLLLTIIQTIYSAAIYYKS